MPDEAFRLLDNSARAIEVLRTAAEGAKQENAALSQVVDALTDQITIRHAQSGAERTVGRAAVPFFTNQGYELVDEPAPDPETPGRHEAPEPAHAPDTGVSTTPDTPSKEN